ncbi:MAG: HAD family phosphatase [Lewinella sp.]
MEKATITTLFLDIGGVLLSNGWGHEFRYLAAERFGLDVGEMEERHKVFYVVYEEGRMTLAEYLNHVVFYEARDFTPDDFRMFMCSLTTPNDDMIDLIKGLKQKYGLKIVVVSNEARELNAYRIKTFSLHEFVDFFVSSCFVGVRKPDAAIYRLALDGAQVPTGEIVYIDDLLLFIEVAGELGVRGIRHTDYATTAAALAKLGLSLP